MVVYNLKFKMLGQELQTSFRAVPDGQYTQTIYSLIRDQKYMEVSKH